jgi:hypothetical protein
MNGSIEPTAYPYLQSLLTTVSQSTVYTQATSLLAQYNNTNSSNNNTKKEKKSKKSDNNNNNTIPSSNSAFSSVSSSTVTPLPAVVPAILENVDWSSAGLVSYIIYIILYIL